MPYAPIVLKIFFENIDFVLRRILFIVVMIEFLIHWLPDSFSFSVEFFQSSIFAQVMMIAALFYRYFQDAFASLH